MKSGLTIAKSSSDDVLGSYIMCPHLHHSRPPSPIEQNEKKIINIKTELQNILMAKT